MPNVEAYAIEVGDKTLSELPFSTLDSLILTQIVYMPFEGLLDDKGSRKTLIQAWDYLYNKYPDSFEDRYQRKRYNLTKVSALQRRYMAWELHDYVNIIDDRLVTQFAAMSVSLDDGSEYIAFRGTDLSLAGWKEDFNMSFLTPVPAQSMSVRYLEEIASASSGAVYMGGHSKGGNLAIYAGIHTSEDISDRIARVYSFDGPGLDEGSLSSEGYHRIAARVESVIPQGSVVGMLMSYHPVYTVVHAEAPGIFQHDAMTWQVRDCEFEKLDRLDLTGQITDRALNEWLGSMDSDDRRRLVDAIFSVVDATNVDTLDELVEEFALKAGKALLALRQVDPQVRKSLRGLLRCFLSTGTLNIVRGSLAGLIRLGNPIKPTEKRIEE